MLAVVKRLTASGFSEAQAEAVIEAIGDVRDDLATRADMQAQSAEFRVEMAALRSDMQAERAEFRSEMATLRADMQAQSAELRSEMAALRSDMQAQSAELRSDMHSDMQALELRLTIRLGAVVGATSLVTIGVIAALIALL